MTTLLETSKIFSWHSNPFEWHSKWHLAKKGWVPLMYSVQTVHHYACIPLVFKRKTQYINCVHNRIFPKNGRGAKCITPPQYFRGGGPMTRRLLYLIGRRLLLVYMIVGWRKMNKVPSCYLLEETQSLTDTKWWWVCTAQYQQFDDT